MDGILEKIYDSYMLFEEVQVKQKGLWIYVVVSERLELLYRLEKFVDFLPETFKVIFWIISKILDRRFLMLIRLSV